MFEIFVSEGITWTLFTGMVCRKFRDDAMQWLGSVDECRTKCLEYEGCRGFDFYPPGPGPNCYGQADACSADDLTADPEEGAQTYIWTEGILDYIN